MSRRGAVVMRPRFLVSASRQWSGGLARGQEGKLQGRTMGYQRLAPSLLRRAGGEAWTDQSPCLPPGPGPS